MKKLFLILIVFSSCKKDPHEVEIQVTETGSNSGVAGANVSLRRCARLGCAFGLVTEYTGTTNNAGICKVPEDKWNKIPVWNDATLVSKPGYWTEVFSRTTSLSLVPEGQIRLRIIRGSNYPQGSILNINISPEISRTGTALGASSGHDFNAAADSIVLMMGFGNQNNKLDWRLINSSTVLKNGSGRLQVPRQGTVNVQLTY